MTDRPTTVSTIARYAMSSTFLGIGTLHFVAPKSFESTIPEELPAKSFLVYASGVAEVVGGVQLLRRPTRRLGWALVALLVAVFPANVNMAVRDLDLGGSVKVPRWALWARLPLQLVMIWAVLRATRPEPGPARS